MFFRFGLQPLQVQQLGVRLCQLIARLDIGRFVSLSDFLVLRILLRRGQAGRCR